METSRDADEMLIPFIFPFIVSKDVSQSSLYGGSGGHDKQRKMSEFGKPICPSSQGSQESRLGDGEASHHPQIPVSSSPST